MAIAGLYKMFDHWHKEGTLYIYSDPHFDDMDLAAGLSNRPSAEEQVKMINSKVGKKDTIIFLGDIGNVEWVRKIRGYKILIMGNHDAGRTNYERKKEREMFVGDYDEAAVIAAMKDKYPNHRYEAHENWGFHAPFEWWEGYADNLLFDEVFEGPVMLGEKLILSHEPVDVPWAFNIHGHDHAGAKRKNHLNVCADVIGYTPVNMNQFMKSGALSHVETIHRQTIDIADAHAKKRGYKLGQNKK